MGIGGNKSYFDLTRDLQEEGDNKTGSRIPKYFDCYIYFILQNI